MASPIPPSVTIPTTPIIQAAAGSLPELKTGSVLLALVMGTEKPNPQQIKQGLQRIQLKLEGQLITVSSSKSLEAGTTVKLQVTGPNQWALLPNIPSAKAAPADLNAWTQAQRQSLPAQAELGLVLRNLLTQSTSLANLSQNSVLQAMAKILMTGNRELLATMLSKRDVANPSKVSDSIKNSGLQFESKLLNKAGSDSAKSNSGAKLSAAGGNDLKHILLKTAQQLEKIKPIQAKNSAPASETITANKQHATNQPSTTNKQSTANNQGVATSKNSQQPAASANRQAASSGKAAASQAPAANPASAPGAQATAASTTSATIATTYRPLSGTGKPTNNSAQPGKRSSETPIASTEAGGKQTIKAPIPTPTGARAERGTFEVIEAVLRELNGGIAKIQLQQLQSVGSQNQWSNPANVQNSWLLDLPVLNHPNVDSFSVRIDQEKPESNQENAKTENGWVVTLRFDLDRIGPIAIKARLAGLQVSMDVWSERPAILAMLKRELADLETSLISKGLEVKSLQCHFGELKEPRPVVEQSLIHIET